MAAKKKITREAIVKAAFDLLRKKGEDAVNARSIARALGCSTQPIYLTFGSMEELKTELFNASANKHFSEVKKYLDDDAYGRYKAYGLGFVRFAKEEKLLFRYLYLNEWTEDNKFFTDVNLPSVIEALTEDYGYDVDTAKKFHSDMTVYSYGLAIGMNIGVLDLTDEEISGRLQTEFIALTAVYGKPPKWSANI